MGRFLQSTHIIQQSFMLINGPVWLLHTTLTMLLSVAGRGASSSANKDSRKKCTKQTSETSDDLLME